MAMDQHATMFKQLLQQYRKITILSHVNPDPDAIGTALGVYDCLKKQQFQVEVVNVTEHIPRYLDFLPHFGKIKQKIDFADSLVIACDCGSLDRLGFALKGREIVNIDHHATNSRYGILNIVDTEAVSSSEVAFDLLEKLYPISRESAIAFYAALVSDTRNFTTNNMSRSVFEFAAKLVTFGVDIAEVTQKMLHRRSLASLRILGVAIDSLELREDARIAILKISQEDLKRTGAKMSDLDGVVDYAKSLATVEVALMLVERERDIKVSLRSKERDIGPIASYFGGGGHVHAGGFEKEGEMQLLTDEIIEEIRKRGVLG